MRAGGAGFVEGDPATSTGRQALARRDEALMEARRLTEEKVNLARLGAPFSDEHFGAGPGGVSR
jgi:hypothetical protein